MRRCEVLNNGSRSGLLSKTDSGEYHFVYDDEWLIDKNKTSLSLTMPKRKKEFRSDTLFPFFINLLCEGHNKEIQCRLLKIDPKDYFSLLFATARYDTVGAITVRPITP